MGAVVAASGCFLRWEIRLTVPESSVQPRKRSRWEVRWWRGFSTKVFSNTWERDVPERAVPVGKDEPA